jgi:hypothetical protein
MAEFAPGRKQKMSGLMKTRANHAVTMFIFKNLKKNAASTISGAACHESQLQTADDEK